jgi:hypothetical protein
MPTFQRQKWISKYECTPMETHQADHGGRAAHVFLRPRASSVSGFESLRGHGCWIIVLCVVRLRWSLRRADPSSRGVPPSVCVCVCVCVSLSVFRSNNNILHLKQEGRRGQTNKGRRTLIMPHFCILITQRHLVTSRWQTKFRDLHVCKCVYVCVIIRV